MSCFIEIVRVYGGCKFRAAARVPTSRPTSRISLTSLPQRSLLLLFPRTIFSRHFATPVEISASMVYFRVRISTRCVTEQRALEPLSGFVQLITNSHSSFTNSSNFMIFPPDVTNFVFSSSC